MASAAAPAGGSGAAASVSGGSTSVSGSDTGGPTRGGGDAAMAGAAAGSSGNPGGGRGGNGAGSGGIFGGDGAFPPLDLPVHLPEAEAALPCPAGSIIMSSGGSDYVGRPYVPGDSAFKKPQPAIALP